jgi:hypothetical protein
MNEPLDESVRFPLLTQLSRQRGMQILAIYKMHEAAALFGASRRAMNDRVADGQLTVRDLPGHGRFLPQDLEEFLAASAKKREPRNPQPRSAEPPRNARLSGSART